MGPGPDGVRIVRPAICQPSDPVDPGDRPQNRSRFCSLRVLITQNPVGKRLIQAIFGAAKFAKGNRKFPAARRSSAKSLPILLPAGFDRSKPGWKTIDPGDIWPSQIRWDTGRLTDLYPGYPCRRRWCWKSCPQLRSCRSALHPIQHSWSACGS